MNVCLLMIMNFFIILLSVLHVLMQTLKCTIFFNIRDIHKSFKIILGAGDLTGSVRSSPFFKNISSFCTKVDPLYSYLFIERTGSQIRTKFHVKRLTKSLESIFHNLLYKKGPLTNDKGYHHLKHYFYDKYKNVNNYGY